MKKALEALFMGDDGRVSWTAVASFVGIILTIQWNVHYYYLGWQYKPDELTFLEFIIGAFLFGRVVQRGVYYGTNALQEIKTSKTAAPKQNPTPAPLPKQGGNFNISEFESKDGTKMSAAVKANVLKLIEQLEIIRAACGNKPITITSGYRSVKHNASVGGAKNSQHTKGKAADFKVKGMRPIDVYKTVENLMDSGQIAAGGIGLYKSWVHYDIRGTKATWKG